MGLDPNFDIGGSLTRYTYKYIRLLHHYNKVLEGYLTVKNFIESNFDIVDPSNRSFMDYKVTTTVEDSMVDMLLKFYPIWINIQLIMVLDDTIVGPDAVSYLPPFRMIDKVTFKNELSQLKVPLAGLKLRGIPSHPRYNNEIVWMFNKKMIAYYFNIRDVNYRTRFISIFRGDIIELSEKEINSILNTKDASMWQYVNSKVFKKKFKPGSKSKGVSEAMIHKQYLKWKETIITNKKEWNYIYNIISGKYADDENLPEFNYVVHMINNVTGWSVVGKDDKIYGMVKCMGSL